jgi:hypothetical protein
VRDTTGVPVRDAEVMLPILGNSTKTDAAGRFVLLGIVPGRHEVMFRRIGYVSVPFDWVADEGKRVEIAVTLRPLPNTLDPVVVYANETRALKSNSRVTGVVIDSAGLPVPFADVQLIGTTRNTMSKDDGTFEFRHVPPGTVTLRARHMGYAPSALIIELQDNDLREVALRIRRLDQTLDTVKVAEASGYGSTDAAWRELGRREKWRSASGMDVIGPKALQDLGGMPLDWLIRPYLRDKMSRPPMLIVPNLGGRSSAEPPDDTQPPNVCILENGIFARFIPLMAYVASDLQRVEYYPPSPPEREYTGTVEARMTHPACKRGPDGAHPAYYVLWLKTAR